ncbi:hypothetical protein MANES_01G172650v8 [Manihot esculenta]|uniref:Uncharacterized protein n=1 Tax=Manihot esculenta TaxID=3983 RepID=A0ACB7IFQ4_MANES|nr:hypothetical protein MANES_01G172650v8 [Manihot esculenta]
MKCMVRVMLKASNGNIESEVEKEHKMEQVDNDGDRCFLVCKAQQIMSTPLHVKPSSEEQILPNQTLKGRIIIFYFTIIFPLLCNLSVSSALFQ